MPQLDNKYQIKDQLGLVASVGIATNKFLAKLASDLDKPDGFVVITEENKQQILDPLQVSKIWGVGKVTQKALKSIGINNKDLSVVGHVGPDTKILCCCCQLSTSQQRSNLYSSRHWCQLIEIHRIAKVQVSYDVWTT